MAFAVMLGVDPGRADTATPDHLARLGAAHGL